MAGLRNQQLIQRDVRLGKCMAPPRAIGHCHRQQSAPIEGDVRHTNIEKFLKAVMPRVPSHFTTQMVMRERGCNVEYGSPHFVLADLWESFSEWSAFGVGVPLMLNDCDYLVQYYVPYLSGIQIYVDPIKYPPTFSSTKMAVSSNGGSQENEGTSCHQTADLSPKMENLSLKDKQTDDKQTDAKEIPTPGRLLYQHLEQEPPFKREPLVCKVSQLAADFPELMTLRSCDILHTSWLSVAWYPIYRIPIRTQVKELETCFLTYHYLSTPTLPLGGDARGVKPPILTNPKIPLPSFALSSYKFRGSTWTSGTTRGQHIVNSLSTAASNWLGARQVCHPDYNFFVSRQ